MTIALPGSSKLGFAGLLSRKRSDDSATKRSGSGSTIKRQEIVSRFVNNAPVVAPKPAKLNDNEKQDRDRLSSLRGALYAKD